MGHFETNLLQDYNKTFKKELTLWLRIIDDVFIVWTEYEAKFNHFINSCKTCASSKDYKSKINFTSS